MESTLEVKGVEKRYGGAIGGMLALDGITFSIAAGEFVAIIGPSGSGKSTLLNVMGALDRPTSGAVLIAGSNLSEMSNSELAALRNERIGFVFQSFNLIPRMTSLENIALPMLFRGLAPGERRIRAVSLLEGFGIASKAENKPSQLSGGEQQRVAVARALANDPPILLADEPTGNLDTKNAAETMRILQDLNEKRGKTLVVITHNEEIARTAHRTISLRDGKLERISVN